MKTKFSLFFFSFFIVLLVVSGAWLYGRQTLFRLAEVHIITKQESVKKAVLEKLVPSLGKDFLALSLSELATKINEVSYVRSVTLRKKWPSTLLVNIQERKALFCTRKDKILWLLDEEGVFLEKANCQNYPILEGQAEESEIVKKIGHWLSELNKESWHFDSNFLSLNKLEWDELHGLKIQFHEAPLTLVLGHQDLEKNWLKALNAILRMDSKQLNESRVLDASYKNRVLVRLAPKLQNSNN